MNEPLERLADSFKPSRYELFLQPNPEQLTFSGKVTIDGQLIKPSQMIKLHAKGLRIDSANFTIGGGEHQFSSIKYGDDDVLYLVASTKLSDSISLTLEFFGEITEPMVGMYISNFEDKGVPKQIVATQFESHHAREVFPCVDEPAAKALFDLTLMTPTGNVVLANTPSVSEAESDGWTTTTFATSPVMSTYLLAFAFGPLVSKEGTSRGGTLVRVWSTPLHQDHTQFALDTAIKSLDALENFFCIPFPLTKIDHLALPDFAAGAMENWGLIIYRESVLVVDPTNTTLEDKQNVATVIAHELSHQWFGNLVTMSWWTDLWLNEGFASWLEVYIADQLFPDWRLWDQFASDSYLAAQSLDALASSHPIEIPVNDPDDIRSIFDAISYDKGASVLRMLYQYLGHDHFSHGLKSYLENHQYGNATTADLWSAMESVSKRPVKDFMTKWTSQVGFPLVLATISDRGIDLKQQRFLINPDQKPEASLWPIPIDTVHNTESFLMDQTQHQWAVTEPHKAKLNRGQAGFYLVGYDDSHLARLSKMVEQGELEAIDRLGLLNDSFTLAKSNHHPTTEALSLLSAYSNEDNSVVWDIIAGQLSAIRSVFASEDLRGNMKRFLVALVQQQLKRLGWDETAQDSHFDKLLRPTILALAAAAEEPSVIAQIDKRFDAMELLDDIPADLRSVVLNSRARRSTVADYEKLLVLYKQTHSAQAKHQLAGALCAVSQPDLIKRSLDLVTTSDVRLQDVVYWVSFLLHNPFARDAAWAWEKDNWSWLVEKFGNDIMTFSAFPKLAGKAFSTRQMQADYEQFFKSAHHAGIDMPVRQGLETLKWQTAWRERDEQSILDFFKNWRLTGPAQVNEASKPVISNSEPDTSIAESS